MSATPRGLAGPVPSGKTLLRLTPNGLEAVAKRAPNAVIAFGRRESRPARDRPPQKTQETSTEQGFPHGISNGEV